MKRTGDAQLYAEDEPAEREGDAHGRDVCGRLCQVSRHQDHRLERDGLSRLHHHARTSEPQILRPRLEGTRRPAIAACMSQGLQQPI